MKRELNTNITPDNSKTDGICVVIEPNGISDSTNWGHNHDEIGVVIEGELELEVAEEGIYNLFKGDSIYIKKILPTDIEIQVLLHLLHIGFLSTKKKSKVGLFAIQTF